jgi:hypothetical protein
MMFLGFVGRSETARSAENSNLPRRVIIRTMFGLNGRQVFFILVFVAVLFAATQYGPAYFAAFQFNDFVRQEVKFAAAAQKDVDRVRNEILEKAMELGILLGRRDIRMTRRGPAVIVEFEYRWPIDLRVYQHDLVFHVSESGEMFENASN